MQRTVLRFYDDKQFGFLAVGGDAVGRDLDRRGSGFDLRIAYEGVQ